MADGYTIRVQKTKSANNTSDVNQVAKDDAKQKDLQKAAISTAIINTGKQAIMTGVNQYNALTGDVASAKQLNFTIGLAADIATMATGPIGIISVVSSKAVNAISSVAQTTMANRQINFNNSALGEISRAGSRYY